MIFSSYKERERVYEKIDGCELFDELTPEDNFVISSMYDCLNDIRSVLYDYEADPRASRETITALEEAESLVMGSIAGTYIGMLDSYF